MLVELWLIKSEDSFKEIDKQSEFKAIERGFKPLKVVNLQTNLLGADWLIKKRQKI